MFVLFCLAGYFVNFITTAYFHLVFSIFHFESLACTRYPPDCSQHSSTVLSFLAASHYNLKNTPQVKTHEYESGNCISGVRLFDVLYMIIRLELLHMNVAFGKHNKFKYFSS